MPDASSTFADFYTYTCNSEINPLSVNDLFLNEYEMSNLENGQLTPQLLPIYLNRNQVDSVNNTGLSWKGYHTKIKKNNDGLPNLITLYSHYSLDISIQEEWKLFYKNHK